jgi:hypothetical protein
MFSWVNISLEEAALSRKKQRNKNNLTQVVYFLISCGGTG